MTLYNRKKKKLFERFKNKKYRDAFVEESINVGIPFQIKALREDAGYTTQKDFAKATGMQQPLISRLENPNYANFSLSTLKKIASIFNVGLIVRFAPLSKLIEWQLNLNSEAVKPISYKDDPYFKENDKEETATLGSGQYTEVYPSITSNKVAYIKNYLPKATKISTQGNINARLAR